MTAAAYAREMADTCLDHGIDAFEASQAACTKHFELLSVAPSLGVGGRCIPISPHYLLSNSAFPPLEAATEKARLRPAAMAERIMRDISKQNTIRTRRKARVLVIGAACKRGQSLVTGSPAVELMRHLLSSWDVYVAFADPLVQESAIPFAPRLDEKTQWTKAELEWFDTIIVAVRQLGLDYLLLDSLEDVKIESWN